MIESVLRVYAFNLDYVRKLVADVDEAKMCVQPATGMNHAAWVLGHLATSADYTGKLLGAKPVCPATWDPLFGNKSHPTTDRSLYPAKAELWGALAEGHSRVAAAYAGASPDDLGKPFQGQAFPTMGDWVAFLMTSHEAIHYGQLSAWRRAQGLPGIM